MELRWAGLVLVAGREQLRVEGLHVAYPFSCVVVRVVGPCTQRLREAIWDHDERMDRASCTAQFSAFRDQQPFVRQFSV